MRWATIGYAHDFANWKNQEAALDAAGRLYHQQMAALRQREVKDRELQERIEAQRGA